MTFKNNLMFCANDQSFGCTALLSVTWLTCRAREDKKLLTSSVTSTFIFSNTSTPSKNPVDEILPFHILLQAEVLF